jgi:hypothetical protein
MRNNMNLRDSCLLNQHITVSLAIQFEVERRRSHSLSIMVEDFTILYKLYNKCDNTRDDSLKRIHTRD